MSKAGIREHARNQAIRARKGVMPWIYWGVAATFYLYEFFARVGPSVMESTLQEQFQLSAAGMGFVMGLYYFAYAPMQLVVGIALDRFGSKRLLSSAAIIAGFGCLLFALAKSATMLGVGRVFLGIGSSFAYVGAVYVATVWFPKSKLAFIMGMTAALGTLGAALGQAPLESAVQSYGWRSAMYTAAIGGLIIATAIFMIVPRRPQWFLQLASIKTPETKETMASALLSVVSRGQTWLVGCISLLIYVPITTFGALWGDTYIETTTGVSKESAAWAMSMLFFGFAAGGPLLGLLSDKIHKRNLPLLGGSIGCCITMTGLIFSPTLPFWFVVVLLTCTGFFVGAQAITFAIAVEQHESYHRATAVAFVNFFVMLGGFLLQPAFGAMLDVVSDGQQYSAENYQFALILLPLSIGLGTVLCYWLKETAKE